MEGLSVATSDYTTALKYTQYAFGRYPIPVRITDIDNIIRYFFITGFGTGKD